MSLPGHVYLTTREALENSTCRICGCQNNAVFLNLMKPDNEQFLTLVKNVLCIQVTEDDRLPKHICHSCTATLYDIQQLLTVSKIVQQKLASIAEKLNCDEVKVNKIECEDFQEKVDNSECEKKNHSIIVGNAVTSCKISNSCKGSISMGQDVLIKVPAICLPKIPQCPKIESDEVKKIRSSKPYNPGSVLRKKLPVNSVPKCTSEPADSRTHSVQTPEPVDASPKTDVRPKNWLIHKLPGNSTTLYVCPECQAILLCPEAKEKHVCDLPVAGTVSPVSSDSDVGHSKLRRKLQMKPNCSDSDSSPSASKIKKTDDSDGKPFMKKINIIVTDSSGDESES